MNPRPTARALAVVVTAALLALAGCGDSETEPGSEEPIGDVAEIEAPEANCEPGGSAAAVREQPERNWPSPPQPVVFTEHSAGCAEQIGACPPWVKDCGIPFVLSLPEEAVAVGEDDVLIVDFGAPVDRVEEQLGVAERCRTEASPSDDPARWQIELPDYIWSDRPQGCGQGGTLAGSMRAEYGPDGTFEDYFAAWGIKIRVRR